jgi:hypothetical protein
MKRDRVLDLLRGAHQSEMEAAQAIRIFESRILEAIALLFDAPQKFPDLPFNGGVFQILVEEVIDPGEEFVCGIFGMIRG